MNVRLPRLPGKLLRQLREDFGLDRSTFAQSVGTSEDILILKEKSDSLGESFAAQLSNCLLDERGAALSIGLSVASIQAAEAQGLRVAATSFGNAYFLPLIYEWAARVRSSFPRSLASQAAHLSALLGLEPEEGTARCSACEQDGAGPHRIAFRTCSFCQAQLCTDRTCGEEVYPDATSGRELPQVACAQCLKDRSLARLTGTGKGRCELLAKQYEQITENPAQSYIYGFLDRVEPAYREATIFRDNVVVNRSRDGAAFRLLVDANREVAEIVKLIARVKGDLQSTHMRAEVYP